MQKQAKSYGGSLYVWPHMTVVLRKIDPSLDPADMYLGLASVLEGPLPIANRKVCLSSPRAKKLSRDTLLQQGLVPHAPRPFYLCTLVLAAKVGNMR